jgi:DNA polymerase-3 subunit gamma/tau
MALLQALPGLRGEDEEQDAALAVLAAKFLPEDLQLLYQIAIMARRDLDYAPDARGGFEMALLRMLAFRPESLSGAASSGTPPAAKAAPAASSPRKSPGAPQAVSTPPAAPVSPRAAIQPDVAADDDWPAIVAALGLQGPAGQLAAHCVLVGRTDDLVRLRLDRAGEVFRRPQLEQKLAQALAQRFGQPVRLDIAVSEAEEVTPARQHAKAADARLKAAEQAIEADSNVRAMREVFGATVQPGSVKPLN